MEDNFPQDIELPVVSNTTIVPNDDDGSSDEEDNTPVNTFGFKSSATPPPVRELQGLECDWWKLINSIKFTNKKTPFQKQLSKDCVDISKLDNLQGVQ